MKKKKKNRQTLLFRDKGKDIKNAGKNTQRTKKGRKRERKEDREGTN